MVRLAAANACDPGVKAQWLSQFSGAEYNCFSTMLAYLISYPADQAVIGQIYNLCVGELVKAASPPDEQAAQCVAERVAQYFKLDEAVVLAMPA